MYAIYCERSIAIRYWAFTYSTNYAARMAAIYKGDKEIPIAHQRTKKDAERFKETLLSVNAFVQGRLKRRTFGGHVWIK